MLTALITFAAAGALVVVLPGPDTLVALRSLALRGRRGGVATGAGILTGLTVWALAAALGISAILRASHWGWLGLRIAGAGYLVVMGVRALQASRRTRQGTPEASPARRGGLLGTGYRAGLATDLLNPKVGVFFITFLPAFIPRGDDPAWPSLALGAIFVLETALYLAVLVVLAGRIRRWLDHPAIRRRLDRITGTVLIGFGVRLVVER